MKSQLGHRKTRPERQETEPGGSEWEWEVLPPEDRRRGASLEALFR